MTMLLILADESTGIKEAIVPLAVFFGFLLAIWAVLSWISERNSRSTERLMRHSRPASLAEIEDPKAVKKSERFQGITDMAKSISQPLMPQTELEQSALKVKLANAGFRSESAAAVYSGIRVASLGLFLAMALGLAALNSGTPMDKIKIILLITVLGFYLPSMALWWLRRKRQQEIFLTLPDALDLLVVCVESGLGLDAAMRKVCDEMKEHARVLCDEIALANFQLQMGRPKREVLHDLGVRTGVDDVKSLAAILIQADRFGSSVAQALRVQSDSMRVKRRQIAEEKAAKTAVQMIFPLVLFIFPGIFVVLVGPAAVAIYQRLLKK
ncbi:MAG TPA: type II secretion system F family protein [Gemmataceae bacterium]|jgi:tight adherence protein C|nr:type II secretion system F family protein [Gemmataceae bacterium]